MIGEDKNNRKWKNNNNNNTASNSSHFAFSLVKLLELNGLPGVIWKFFFLM